MILRRPPHAAHSLMSEETPAPAGSPTAADGRRTQRSHRRPSPTARQPAWPPRCARGPGPGAPGPVVAQEMKPGGGTRAASFSSSSIRESRRGRVPSDHGVLSAKERWSASIMRRRPPPPGPAGPRSGTSVRAPAGQGLRSALPQAAKSRAKQSTRAPYAPRWRGGASPARRCACASPPADGRGLEESHRDDELMSNTCAPTSIKPRPARPVRNPPSAPTQPPHARPHREYPQAPVTGCAFADVGGKHPR